MVGQYRPWRRPECLFCSEGRTIRRSSHALVSDHSDIDTDCNSATELFATFAENDETDVVVYAHCGGRYADIELAHDGRFENPETIRVGAPSNGLSRMRSGLVTASGLWPILMA